VEGYIESAASGLLAGINAARLVEGMKPFVLPVTTALGSLLAYISDSSRRDFQPMNANFGLLPPLPTPARGKAKRGLMVDRALKDLEHWKTGFGRTTAFELVQEA
jgi:methylenetetrahydrofolate--tRNA-(uracil-5-)-methyltransferase